MEHNILLAFANGSKLLGEGLVSQLIDCESVTDKPKVNKTALRPLFARIEPFLGGAPKLNVKNPLTVDSMLIQFARAYPLN